LTLSPRVLQTVVLPSEFQGNVLRTDMATLKIGDLLPTSVYIPLFHCDKHLF